jgi:hypothetical protein
MIQAHFVFLLLETWNFNSKLLTIMFKISNLKGAIHDPIYATPIIVTSDLPYPFYFIFLVVFLMCIV